MNKTISRIWLISFLLLTSISGAVRAQSLSTKSIDFGNLNIGKKDSIKLSVNLGRNQDLKVSVRLYGEAFQTKFSRYELNRGGDTSIWIVFKPTQNIAYNGEIFIGYNNRWLLKADVKGNGKMPNKYYKSTFNLYDNDLKAELKKITSSGQKSLGYNGARDEMYSDLDNYNGKVTCVYTGRVATFNSRGGANSNSFNCEHTWPQSKFCSSESGTMKADIHHLFATDAGSNSRRGNYPFGKVTGSVTWEEGGSKLGGGLFEPRDEQKGITARSMFYMLMRYDDCSSFLGSQENTLRNWHEKYLPENKEVNRNKGIFDLQNNRNPFVDAPFFVDRITSFKGNKTRETKAAVVLVDTLVEEVSYRNDSTIYIAYLVNIGTAAFEISEVTGDFSNYTTTATKVAPGEATRIRYAFNGRVTGLLNSLISFKQGYLETAEVLFQPSNVGIRKKSQVQLIAINGNLIEPVGTEPISVSIYTLGGKSLFKRDLNEPFNLSGLNYKGLVLISVQNKEGRDTVKKLIR